MLRFVIGLGINSICGEHVERALSEFYPLAEFEIVPMVESDTPPANLQVLKDRSADYAKRVQTSHIAEAYFGITSGQVFFCLEKDGPTSPARTDVVTTIVNNELLSPELLDPGDIRWQVKSRLCGVASTRKAISELLTIVSRRCAVKALPKPL